MSKKKITIASRKSPLALVQTEIIKQHLEGLYPELTVSILPMSTAGDKQLTMPLATVGGKSLFVKELEQAIFSGEADMAVHSAKDMPVVLPTGLIISTFYKRDDPRDVFISNHHESLATMPPNAVVGTSSLRRQCLIKHLHPDLDVKVLRGNVQTRLKKLDSGEYDGIILAAAGLKRQNLQSRINEFFDPTIFIPASTQGIMCIECREEDADLQALLKPLHHSQTAFLATAERSMNLQLQGGCQVPIGAYATLDQRTHLKLQGLVGSPDGRTILTSQFTALPSQAKQLGIMVANDLLKQGAQKILDEVYQQHG